MNTTDPTSDDASYTARPRVLVISSGVALPLMIEQTLDRAGIDGAIDQVDDYSQALHLIENDTPQLLIATEQSIESKARLDQLRTAAPQALIWMIATSRDAIDPQLTADKVFDQLIIEPVRPDILEAMLKTAMAPFAKLATGEQALDPSEVPPESDRVGTGPNTNEPQPLHLGDTDLLEQMLCNPTSVRDIALKLIGQHWQAEGLGWVEESEQVPSGHQSTAVELAGQLLGYLHTEEGSDSAKLKSWANWLAHWLALQKRLVRLEEMAMHDELTGIWNRRYFNQFLKMVLDCAGAQRFGVTLLLFDLDDFKTYNDRFGHIAGDQILQETANLMQSLVREHDVVARIGGDEFAVIFWDAEQRRRPDSEHPADVRAIAQRFQDAVYQQKFPKLGDEAGGKLTVSGGLASFPWDGHTVEQLIEKADLRLLESKKQGKNVITFGPAARRDNLPQNEGA